MSVNATEIYAEIQSRFEAALKAGTVPWQRPWVGELSAPRNLQSGKPYRGINSLLLGLSGYDDPRWTTFAAAKKMGGKVRKGEHSTLVTLWKRIKIKDAAAPNGEKTIAILRYFRVFNVAQADWPEGAIPALKETQRPDDWNAIQAAEDTLQSFLDSEGAPTLSYGGSSAYYDPTNHRIKLPVAGDFHTAEGFYATAFHESAHSTGPMLGREFGRFGDAKYGREELVAEMAQAFVLATISVEIDYDNSAAYIKGWMRAIQDDDKLIVKAAGQAQKAADRILGTYFTEPLDSTATVVAEPSTAV